MSEAEMKEIEKNGDAKVYEVVYLLVPTTPEENVPALYTNLKDLVQSLGGSIVADDMPKMISLAYAMTKVVSNVRSKFTSAYFGWVKFTMQGAEVLELKKKLDLDPNIIRFLITKTVKENTIAAKRFVRPDMHRKPSMKKDADGAESMPLDNEKIDQEIDAMVAA